MSGPLLSLRLNGRDSIGNPFGTPKNQRAAQSQSRTNTNESSLGKARPTSSNGSLHKQAVKQLHSKKQSEKNSKFTNKPNASKTNEPQRKQSNKSGSRSSKLSQGPSQSSSRRILRSDARTSHNHSKSLGEPDSDQMQQDTMDSGSGLEELAPMKRIPRQGPTPLQHFSEQAILATGPLFPNPEALGFMKRQQAPRPRPCPRYMMIQPRLLTKPPFKQNEWDRLNQEKMVQMEEANNGADFQGLYEEFQKMREVERSQMELLGLVDAENTTKDLNDAIFFQGTCLDMCPTFERVRRALENNVKALEKDFSSQKISRARAVKAFSRPAAGQPPPMPSDVRPPHILSQTLDYLIGTILPQLPDSHSFIWDRTRSIRQDFVYQNYYGPEAIDCNEKIVRIHLLCMHIMASANVEFSHQQEMEQFNKALQTLMEMYEDVRNHGGQCPNEAEFRAYHLLSHFRDPELEREIQTLPDCVFNDRQVQLALQFRLLMSQNNIVERGYTNKIGAANMFVKFFELAFSETTPVLMACILETHLNEIRFYALKSLSRSYHTGGKALLGTSLEQMLGFDSLQSMVDFVHYYEVETFTDDENVLLVDLCNKEKLDTVYKLKAWSDKPKRSPATSLKVDARLRSQPLKSYVNAGLPNADLKLNDSYTNKGFATQKQHKQTSSFGVNNVPFGTSHYSFGTNNPPFGTSSSPFGAKPATLGSSSTPFGSNCTPFGNAIVPIGNNAGSFAIGNSLNTTQSNTFGSASTSRGFGTVQSSVSQPTSIASPGSFGQQRAHEPKAGSFKLSDFTKSENSISGAQSTFGRFNQGQPFEANKSNAASENGRFSVNSSSQGTNSQQTLNFGSLPKENSTSLKSIGNEVPASAFSFKASQDADKTFNEKDKKKEIQKEKEKEKEIKTKNESDGFQAKPLFGSSTRKLEDTTPSTTLSPAFTLPKIETKVEPDISNTAHVHFASSPKVIESTPLVPSAKPKQSIKDSPQYYEAIGSVCKEIVASVLDKEVSLTISLVRSANQKADERQRVVDLLSKELFLAFMSEVTFQTAMEVSADQFYVAKLRKMIFRRIARLSKEAHSRKVQRESRLNELESVTFKTPTMKRAKSTTPSVDLPPKRRRTEVVDDRYNDIHQRQDEIKSLWEPLHLGQFLELCAKNVSDLPQSTMKCWFVVENWSLAYSKWLTNKFSLKIENSLYVNEVQSSDLKFRFEELLNKTLTDSQSMKDTAFLVFECGLVDQASWTKYKDLETKLKRDSATLTRIVQICTRFCLYKIQILVIVWDASNSGMTDRHVSECLNFNKIERSQNCVEGLSLCNMTKEQDVTQLLESNLHHVATIFTGQLTAKGLRRKQLERASALTTLATVETVKPNDITTVNTHIQEKEKEILKKGRDSLLRGYLSRHIGGNTSVDLTNTSGFKTPNTSFANRSIATHNKSHLVNNSLSFLGRDASFFKSFANGTILEESTPAGSPRPEPSALPKKILDLINLTASIRERYKS